MDYRSIEYRVDDRVAYVTLNRPDHGNALSEQMHAELNSVWHRVNEDDGVWAAVVQGAGDDFCLGEDIDEIAAEYRKGSKVQRWKLDEAWQRKSAGHAPIYGWPEPAQGLPGKPVVAAIHGRCHGSGLMFPTFADFTLAADDAEFSLPNVHQGSAPWLEVLTLGRTMQRPPVMQLALLGKHGKWNAERAHQLGLVFDVQPRAAFRDRVAEVMDLLVNRSAAVSVRAARTGWWNSFNYPRGHDYRIHHIYMAEVRVTSEDAKEGPRAFAEKRRPAWKAR